MASTAPETVKQCQLCDLKTTSMSFLLRHLTLVHSTKPGFFSCSLNGCQRTFHNITTYKHHVYANHSKHHTNLDSAGVTTAPTFENPDEQPVTLPDDPGEPSSDDSIQNSSRDADDTQKGTHR